MAHSSRWGPRWVCTSLLTLLLQWAATPGFAVPGKVRSVEDALVRVLGFDLGSDGSGADYLGIPSSGSKHPVDEEMIAQKMNALKMM